MRKYLLVGVALALPLTSCAVPAAMGVASAVTVAPQWYTMAQEVIYGIKVLTEAEQLACNMQTAANQRGDAHLSYWFGLGCKW